MLESVSKFKKGFFLLKFTEELIRNSKGSEIFKLEEILREKNLISKEKEDIRESIRKEVISKLKKPELSETNLGQNPFKKSILPPIKQEFQIGNSENIPRVPLNKRRLRIPNTNLPSGLGNLRPAPTEQQIDLGKLNILIKDSGVKTIECPGENEKIIVTGKMGRKPTGINLSKQEIEDVIDEFSKSSKIPKSEGLFKVAYGKLVLTAMVSSTISSTFIIKKIGYNLPIPPHRIG